MQQTLVATIYHLYLITVILLFKRLEISTNQMIFPGEPAHYKKIGGKTKVVQTLYDVPTKFYLHYREVPDFDIPYNDEIVRGFIEETTYLRLSGQNLSMLWTDMVRISSGGCFFVFVKPE